MNSARTVWVGNVADQVTEELLYELFLQTGPLEKVTIPRDREGRKSSFGFITFKHEISVSYAVQLLNGIKLFEKALNIKPRNTGSQKDRQIVQLNMQRSFSYPDETHQRNEHIRFDEHSNSGLQHASYEDLVRMGNMLSLNYSYSENSSSNEFGNNFGSHGWYQDERHREQDNDSDRRNYDYDRDRGRHNYLQNRNHRRNHNKKNNYEKYSGRRNRHY